MGDFYILAYWSAKSSLILFKCQCMYMYALCYIRRETSVECLMHLCSCCTACFVALFKCFVCYKQMRMQMRNIHILRLRLCTNNSLYIIHDGYTFIVYTGNTNRTRNTSTYKKYSGHVPKKQLPESTFTATNQIASLGLHRYTSSVMQYCIYHGTCTCILTTQMSDQNGSTSLGVLSLRCFKICSMPQDFDNVPIG